MSENPTANDNKKIVGNIMYACQRLTMISKRILNLLSKRRDTV